MRGQYRFAGMLASLIIASAACRPIVTIGWTELAIIAIILILLFTPLLLRLVRIFIRTTRTTDREDE
jgi:hypothetical protein